MLEIQNLTKNYPQFLWGLFPKPGLTVFEKLNLEVSENRIYGLTGKNGSGKTTLLKILCGLIIEDSGQLTLNQNNFCEKLRTQHSIYLMHAERNLFWRLTGRQNLIVFTNLIGQKNERIDSVIKQFNLENFIDRPVRTYSQGQMQMTAIARCFLKDYELYLFDEPFLSLDTENCEQVMKMIASLKQPDRHILVSSHEKHLLDSLCDDRIAL